MSDYDGWYCDLETKANAYQKLVTNGLITPNEAIRKLGLGKPIDGNNVPGEEMECALLISDKGLVTSGNYRKFYIKEGKKYSHTIDPISGYPVSHSLICATVIANDATTADALATYFMVIGLEEAKKYLDANPNLQALLMYEENGKIKTFYTDKLEIINFDK